MLLLIHRETVARSTFKSYATSEAFKYAFIHLQYKLNNKLPRDQTVASVARARARALPRSQFQFSHFSGSVHLKVLCLKRDIFSRVGWWDMNDKWFFAMRNIAKKWTMPIRDWNPALNRFAVGFAERFPR